MKSKEIETSTERLIRLSLSVALAILYMTIVVVTYVKLAQAPLSEGVQSIDPAWVGFWGNVVGGVLGLVGGIAAALAAIHVLKRQIAVDARKRRQDRVGALSFLQEILVKDTKSLCPKLKIALEKIEENDPMGAAKAVGPTVGALWSIETEITGYLATISISVTLHLRIAEKARKNLIKAIEEINNLSINRTENPSNSINSLFLCSKFALHLEKLCLSNSLYAAQLLNALKIASDGTWNGMPLIGAYTQLRAFADRYSDEDKRLEALISGREKV